MLQEYYKSPLLPHCIPRRRINLSSVCGTELYLKAERTNISKYKKFLTLVNRNRYMLARNGIKKRSREIKEEYCLSRLLKQMTQQEVTGKDSKRKWKRIYMGYNLESARYKKEHERHKQLKDNILQKSFYRQRRSRRTIRRYNITSK